MSQTRAPTRTIETHVEFRSLGKAGSGGILATIAIHGGLFFMMWWSQRVSEMPEAAPRDLIVTQLVKLGKPREKFWLPRIAQPRPTKTPDQIKIADDPNAKPAAVEAPKPEDAQVSDKLRKALERARFLQADDDEPDEGLATGSDRGTATEATEGDAYGTQIYEAIRNNWNVPVGLIPDLELAKLVATIKVRIGADGTLSGEAIAKSSGNALFDDSCLQAIKTTGKVPAPPPAVAAKVARGVGLNFKRDN